MLSPQRNDWIDRLTTAEFEEYEHRHRWLETARPEQLTPDGEWWKTWLLLAGRGFGKTRCAAEDVASYGMDHPGAKIGVVAETFADGRDVCMEGNSGVIACLPRSAIRHWNRSIGELFLTNNTKYKLFSGDKPDGLRGYEHDRLWWDELAKMMYADEAWTQGQLGLRAGINPQNIVTTTPRPIKIIRDLVERDNVVVTSGSTFDNAANLSDTFLDEVRREYEGTKLGEQELYGQIVLLDDESYFKAEWFAGKNRYSQDEAQAMWNACVGRYAALDTANTAEEHSAYNALVIGDLQRDYRLPIRHVSRQRLEFPELVEWTEAELLPFAHDHKLRACFVEYAASGIQLVQQLTSSGPRWLRSLIVPVKPHTGSKNLPGKHRGWQKASIWAKRDMLALPEPSEHVPWLREYERELFSAPNSTYLDQTDATSMLVNELERHENVFSTRWRSLNRHLETSRRAPRG